MSPGYVSAVLDWEKRERKGEQPVAQRILSTVPLRPRAGMGSPAYLVFLTLLLLALLVHAADLYKILER